MAPRKRARLLPRVTAPSGPVPPVAAPPAVPKQCPNRTGMLGRPLPHRWPGDRARRRRILTVPARSAWIALRCSQNSPTAARDPQPALAESQKDRHRESQKDRHREAVPAVLAGYRKRTGMESRKDGHRGAVSGGVPSSRWTKSSAAGCGDWQPQKTSAFLGVAQVEKGHGWLFPRTVKVRSLFKPEPPTGRCDTIGAAGEAW